MSDQEPLLLHAERKKQIITSLTTSRDEENIREVFI